MSDNPTIEDTKVRVELTFLRKVLKCLQNLEKFNLEDIVWLENGEVKKVAHQDIDDWRFTGLNNKDFALAHLL